MCRALTSISSGARNLVKGACGSLPCPEAVKEFKVGTRCRASATVKSSTDAEHRVPPD